MQIQLLHNEWLKAKTWLDDNNIEYTNENFSWVIEHQSVHHSTMYACYNFNINNEENLTLFLLRFGDIVRNTQ